MKFNPKIAIIGLGYVGLPVLFGFSTAHQVIGYDINKELISNLKKNKIDLKKYCIFHKIKKQNLKFTNEIKDISLCNIFIVTVPTPINNKKVPDLKILRQVANQISKFLKKDDIIIIESTVYPGVTEEIFSKILEKNTKLKLNYDFFCGYSPERINPGDKKHTFLKINKIVAGSNKKTTNKIHKLYSSVLKSKVIKVCDIKTAEAAKVIENTQRDINIGFINELSKIFSSLNINTNEVLKAASTKWNFINFKPGLVGGHCIGIDPYYLAYKAKKLKIFPKIITAGRLTNESMSKFVSNKINFYYDKLINQKPKKILICGISFKANTDDIRNSKIFDVIDYLYKFNFKISVYDPLVGSHSIKKNKKFNFINKPRKNFYNCIFIAVAHKQFKNTSFDEYSQLAHNKFILLDINNIFVKKYTNYYQLI